MQIPVYPFSHQEGHIAAALFGSGHLDWLKQPFLAFHFSGGTSEALLVRPEEGGMDVQKVAGSLDLKAGQAVDRVGQMLGLPFLQDHSWSSWLPRAPKDFQLNRL